MFGTEKKEAKAEAKKYEITVDAARATKNDSIVMVDLDVNGVKIKSCFLKEIECKKDGEKHKKGDKCLVLAFPSEKVGDKYYNRAWFPVTNEHIDEIARQAQDLLS